MEILKPNYDVAAIHGAPPLTVPPLTSDNSDEFPRSPRKRKLREGFCLLPPPRNRGKDLLPLSRPDRPNDDWLSGINEIAQEDRKKEIDYTLYPDPVFLKSGALGYDPADFADAPVIRFKRPAVIECEICRRGHYESRCPYLFEFPPNGELHNKDDFMIICECGRVLKEGAPCPDQKFHPKKKKLVVPKYDYEMVSADDEEPKQVTRSGELHNEVDYMIVCGCGLLLDDDGGPCPDQKCHSTEKQVVPKFDYEVVGPKFT